MFFSICDRITRLHIFCLVIHPYKIWSTSLCCFSHQAKAILLNVAVTLLLADGGSGSGGWHFYAFSRFKSSSKTSLTRLTKVDLFHSTEQIWRFWSSAPCCVSMRGMRISHSSCVAEQHGCLFSVGGAAASIDYCGKARLLQAESTWHLWCLIIKLKIKSTINRICTLHKHRMQTTKLRCV